MTGGKKVIIVGGHRNASLRLARLFAPKNAATSIMRAINNSKDIQEAGATLLLLSRRRGNGGEERTKKVDYEGAMNIFYAIEAVKGSKLRLILVFAIDVRGPEKIPAYCNEADIETSKRVRAAIPAYMHWKYGADKNLVKRDAFKWTILPPGGLTNNPGTGKASAGRTHITTPISRDGVTQALALLVDKTDSFGLPIDIVGGDTPIAEGLDKAIKTIVLISNEKVGLA